MAGAEPPGCPPVVASVADCAGCPDPGPARPGRPAGYRVLPAGEAAAGILAEAPRIVVPPPPEPQITATLDSMGPWNLLGKIKQGQQVATANENTGVQLSGAAQRLITNGARQAVLQSVEADAEAVGVDAGHRPEPVRVLRDAGLQRVLLQDGDIGGISGTQPLRLCGAAGSVVPRGRGGAEGQPAGPAVAQVTKGYGGKDALRVWRQHWDAQQGRDGVRVLPAA